METTTSFHERHLSDVRRAIYVDCTRLGFDLRHHITSDHDAEHGDTFALGRHSP